MFRMIPVVVAVAFLSACTASQEKKVVWGDEFDYEGLPDASRWDYEEGMIRNNEAQYYTRGDEDNAQVENGLLTITALPDDEGRAAYTSASLMTKGKKSFLYGYFEVRAKVPLGRGTWPAIWMLGENISEVAGMW